MRVLIIDDSAFMRRAIERALDTDPAFEVIGSARNGSVGYDKILSLKPDVITLDVEMPEMNGLQLLRKLKAQRRLDPPKVLMCSSLTSDGSREALEAMRLGAADAIAKTQSGPGGAMGFSSEDLLLRLRAICGLPDATERTRAPSGNTHDPSPASGTSNATIRIRRNFELNPSAIDAVVIGSSTGGPPVLESLVSSLPNRLSVPVVVAQHMPATFTKSLAQRLDQNCSTTVLHASNTLPLKPGCVYIVEGGRHGRVDKAVGGRHSLRIVDHPADAPYKPSVNVLFDSAGRVFGPRVLGIMLTGMGDDGHVGARTMHEAGAPILAQDADSCVVYGMPKAVVEDGTASAMLTPVQLSRLLATLEPTSVSTDDRAA